MPPLFNYCESGVVLFRHLVHHWELAWGNRIIEESDEKPPCVDTDSEFEDHESEDGIQSNEEDGFVDDVREEEVITPF
ncbi:unnamed protein product [Parnassius apollo]|uniref:(apollo) hypothetical protein n=1 Tax=Parnassius apollo TaxID=110799 RepID=A0A8S3XBQ2_PARAO|nr:unnamed protein product [Parnassius apollo]